MKKLRVIPASIVAVLASLLLFFACGKETFIVSAVPDDPSQGSVSGGGEYKNGDLATLRATPYSGYAFDKWSDGNTSATRTITVTGNATYKAYFKGDTSITVNFGGATWTASSFLGDYWTNEGIHVIGGKTDDDDHWFTIQLGNISVGTYHASLDTTSSWFWLNDNVNIVEYYESTSFTVGDDTYWFSDWQGWDLTVTISSLTSNTISFYIYGYMVNALEATCTSCPEYVGSFAAATKRYITVSAYNIPFTTESKANGSNTMEELIIAPLSLSPVTSPQK